MRFDFQKFLCGLGYIAVCIMVALLATPFFRYRGEKMNACFWRVLSTVLANSVLTIGVLAAALFIIGGTLFWLLLVVDAI